MSKLIAISILLLTVCLPRTVDAVGKVTVDPNALGAQVTKLEPEKDKRLTQTVTYEAKRKTVLTILDDLTEITGVKYKAGNNNLDWQVRDRKMNIFVKDLPLSNLMNSIARVMKFKWSKSEKDGAVTYRLVEDRRAVLDAQSKRQAKMEQARQRYIEGCQRLLSGLEAANKMSKEELEDLKEKSPYIYGACKSSWAKCLLSVLAEVSSAKDAWLRGDGFAVDFDSLSLGVRQALSSEFMRYSSDFRVENTSNGTIEISGFDDVTRDTNTDNSIGTYMVGVAYTDAEGKKQYQYDPRVISDPGNKSANIRFTSHDKTEWDQYLEWKKVSESERIDMGEPLAKHPEDPDLCKKVKIRVEGDKSSDIFAALAESSGFAVVSDSLEARFFCAYTGIFNTNFPSLETEVRAVLDKLEHYYRYNWEKRGSTLEFNSRDWFRKRDTIIPEAKLEDWRKALKERGTLDLDELAQIAMLRREQVVNMFGDDVLGDAFLTVACNRDLLRLYTVLDAQQQAMIFTAEGLSEKQGLDLDSITNFSNRSMSMRDFGASSWILRAAAKEEPRLVGTCMKQEKQTMYMFTIVTSSGDTAWIWNIKCPIYEPPKEKPKDVKPQPVQATK